MLMEEENVFDDHQAALYKASALSLEMAINSD